jgi:hypothetical protein
VATHSLRATHRQAAQRARGRRGDRVEIAHASGALELFERRALVRIGIAAQRLGHALAAGRSLGSRAKHDATRVSSASGTIGATARSCGGGVLWRSIKAANISALRNGSEPASS